MILIENDPGIPIGCEADPMAGLDAETAETVWSVLGRRLDDVLDEGKAVGTASLGGEVRARDTAIKVRGAFPSTLRSHTRLAATNAKRRLKPIVRETRRDIRRILREWLNGRISFDEVRLQTAKEWRTAYEQIRQIGREASGLDRMGVQAAVLRQEENWFRGAVREELSYWHAFLEDIREERAAGDRLWQRVEAYVKALRFMYEAARVIGLPADNMLFYWMGPKRGDPNICEGCEYMMARSPFTKHTLPAVPRDGSTPCLTNCRHRIVARVVQVPTYVECRARTLPLRETMVRDLRDIRMDRGFRRWTRRAQGAVRRAPASAKNPFRGRPVRTRRFSESVEDIRFNRSDLIRWRDPVTVHGTIGWAWEMYRFRSDYEIEWMSPDAFLAMVSREGLPFSKFSWDYDEDEFDRLFAAMAGGEFIAPVQVWPEAPRAEFEPPPGKGKHRAYVASKLGERLIPVAVWGRRKRAFERPRRASTT